MVELLFMMVILKLPILYLAGVCYWAIKAEPKPPEGARALASPEPGPPSGPERRPSDPPGPHGGPARREARKERVASAKQPA